MGHGMGGQGILQAAVGCSTLSQHHFFALQGGLGRKRLTQPGSLLHVCVHRIMNAEGSAREMQHCSEHRCWEDGIIPSYPMDLHWGTDFQTEKEIFGADKMGLGWCGAGMLHPSAALLHADALCMSLRRRERSSSAGVAKCPPPEH